MMKGIKRGKTETKHHLRGYMETCYNTSSLKYIHLWNKNYMKSSNIEGNKAPTIHISPPSKPLVPGMGSI